ncbi:hypothetical protein F2Q70_00036717 [Brassica cretica]|uniref:Uncharacterized protein n=1 Tax=Brassica cretica TaxID=69181 RepID=A0A8S9JWV9_BRACR|nr:hypothetical protein F2Q70_00036717 [Brassica cretica]
MTFFSLRFSIKAKDSSTGRDFGSTNQEGDNLRRDLCLAAKQNFLEIFQIFAQDITGISPNIYFSLKSSKEKCVFVGFSLQPPYTNRYLATRKKPLWFESSLFLLLMDEGLAKVMQAMSIEEDLPVTLTEDEDFSAAVLPPGFAPRSVVAPEVFEEMQMYMNCTDPEERRLREYKMKKALQDLSSNPGAQSSYLRLEDQPIISGVQNKNVGRVFDFRTAEAEAVGHQNIGEGSNISPLSTHEREININPRADGVRAETHLNENPFMMTMRQPATMEKLQKDIEGAGEFVPSKSGAAFSIGHDNHSASGTSGGSKASKRRGRRGD